MKLFLLQLEFFNGAFKKNITPVKR